MLIMTTAWETNIPSHCTQVLHVHNYDLLDVCWGHLPAVAWQLHDNDDRDAQWLLSTVVHVLVAQ